VHRYADPRDQEVVGFLAAGLAFGQLPVILASVDRALAPLGPAPARALAAVTPEQATRWSAGFVHRWIAAPDLAAAYRLLGSALREAGGLEPLFAAGMAPGHADTREGAAALVDGLRRVAPGDLDLARPGTRSFLPAARGPGAAKRLHLYLRWMVRRDALDLGIWRSATPAQLVIPLDTHVARIAAGLGLTARATPGLAMALEITAALRTLDPEDPVRYDFALAHLGILRACPRQRSADRCAACALLDVCQLDSRRRSRGPSR
jgi:uncharacterized protein (TIGR02757 family)